MVSLKAVATVVTLWVSVTLAQLTITEPSSNRWYSLYKLDCLDYEFGYDHFKRPTGFDCYSYNYDCSKTIVPGEQLKPGTGYTMQFANPFNNTDVFATSESFEVKAVGSEFSSSLSWI
ncbi:dual-specificity kinase [Ceratobasidium sp. AG-Ba]|nr:dual-specificity kinase [Ceratobasidium sp. AG-Ba]